MVYFSHVGLVWTIDPRTTYDGYTKILTEVNEMVFDTIQLSKVGGSHKDKPSDLLVHIIRIIPSPIR